MSIVLFVLILYKHTGALTFSCLASPVRTPRQVVYVDMYRRHLQMIRIGGMIHYLVLEAPANAVAWLRARRTLNNVGAFYLEREGYFIQATVAFFIFMAGWSITLSGRPIGEGLTRSYYLFLLFTIAFQIALLVALREAGLANSSPKHHAAEWCKIRNQLLEEMGLLQEHLWSLTTETALNNQQRNLRPAHLSQPKPRYRRVSLNSGSADQLALHAAALRHKLGMDSAQTTQELKRLAVLERTVGHCIDELGVLVQSFPIHIKGFPLSLTLFRTLTGIFYTQLYVLIVYTLRAVEHK